MESALTISEEEFNYREIELQSKLALATSIIQEKENRMISFDARESEWFQRIILLEEVRCSLHNKVIQLSGNIRVFVRVRPCIPNEEAKAKASTSPFSFPSIFDKDTKATSSSMKVGDDLTKRFIVATEPPKDRGGLSQRKKRMKFGFDNVFSPRNDQDDVWEATEPLIQSAVDGYNVCVSLRMVRLAVVKHTPCSVGEVVKAEGLLPKLSRSYLMRNVCWSRRHKEKLR
jgi:hypothetical protein